MQNNNKRHQKNIYICICVLAVVVSIIFMNAFYWPYKEISKRKILVGIIVFIVVVVLPILCVKISFFYRIINKYIFMIRGKLANKRRNKNIFVYTIVAIVGGMGIAHILTAVLSRYALKTEYNVRLLFLFITLEGIFVSVRLCLKKKSMTPEIIFLILATISGLFCISVTPSKVGVSWDDQIHYERTLEIANVSNGIMYKADIIHMERYSHENGIGYDRVSNHAYRENIEKLYGERTVITHDFSNYNFYSVAYIPAAVGIFLGRGLGMTYTGIFNMGRMFNLFTYVVLIYLAMKRVKYGKIMIAVIGLIPTSIFMATAYSYDWWVIAFTILGLAYFFAELQDEEVLQNRNIIIMVGALVVGCFPKAVYFTLLFPLLFMPKKKFRNSKQKKWYYFSVIAGGFLLVATFLLPMLITGAGSGDARGGIGVNSTEQIAFILKNPIMYIKILLNFCLNYIAMNSSGPMLQDFAYIGMGSCWGIVAIILIVMAFLDRGSKKNNNTGVKASVIIGSVAAVILCATALYISFTPVASKTIAGMSGRYLIPTIYPILYSLGMEGTTHQIDKNVFACIPMLLVVVTFIYNISTFCVLGY